MKTWKVTVFSVEYTKETVQMKSLKTNYTWIHFDNEEIVKVIHDIRPIKFWSPVISISEIMILK